MNDLTLALLVAWVVAGCAVAVALVRRGAPLADAVAALVAWPLLLAVGRPAPPDPRGPCRDAIDRAFGALAGIGSEWSAELVELRAALIRADARLALVDGILADAGVAGGALGASLDGLRTGRERAAAEIAAVLEELLRIRVQVGLHALSGDARPLRAGLRALAARVSALDELATLEGEVDPRRITL